MKEYEKMKLREEAEEMGCNIKDYEKARKSFSSMKIIVSVLVIGFVISIVMGTIWQIRYEHVAERCVTLFQDYPARDVLRTCGYLMGK